MLFRYVMRRVCAVIACVVAVVVCFAQRLEIHHLDIGQGDATVIAAFTPRNAVSKIVLIDGGRKKIDGYYIINYIKNTFKVNTINYVIASHYDADHIGGLITVIENSLRTPTDLGIDIIFDRGDKPPKPVPSGILSIYREKAGQTGKRNTITPGHEITLYTPGSMKRLHEGASEAIKMKCICVNAVIATQSGPKPAVSTDYAQNENNLCVGFVIKFGEFIYVTAGDLNGINEDGMVDIETPAIQVCGNVSAYKVNHHGSSNSTNSCWVTKAKAPVAFISSGKNNGYKHPNEPTIIRLDGEQSLQNFYLTATQDYNNINNKSGTIGSRKKGIINILDNQSGRGFPVILTVDAYNNGTSIAEHSIFKVKSAALKDVMYRKKQLK